MSSSFKIEDVIFRLQQSIDNCFLTINKRLDKIESRLNKVEAEQLVLMLEKDLSLDKPDTDSSVPETEDTEYQEDILGDEDRFPFNELMEHFHHEENWVDDPGDTDWGLDIGEFNPDDG